MDITPFKKIFISAGESSGDMHGANLMRCMLKKEPGLIFYGLGKENMKQAGLHCLHDMSKKSLMWLHALTELSTFLKMRRDCARFFRLEKPDAVILIDYCGFNFHLARAAKKLGIPVIYYISPQLWAHGPWRVKKIKKLVDKLIIIYPFEKPFYEAAGVPAAYVGHPLFDEIAKKGVNAELASSFRKQLGGTIVSFLPGSRRQEIVRMLPLFLEAAVLLKKVVPAAQFLVSCNDEHHHDLIKTITEAAGVPLKIVVGNVHEIVTASDLCIAGAGTVTLQIAHFRKPMIIVYKISPFAYFIAKPFFVTPYIGLVNRLSGKMIVPERLMYGNNTPWLAEQAAQLLCDARKRLDCIHELSVLMDGIGKPGASEQAADEIVAFCKKGQEAGGWQ